MANRARTIVDLFLTAGFAYLSLLIIILAGWIMNLFYSLGAIFHNVPITPRLVIELIGIFVPPLGSLMGWLHLIF